MLVLVQALPMESATSRKINGQLADWSTNSELLAVIADRVGVVAWMYSAVHGKGSSGKPPPPLPRPKTPPTMGEQRPPRRRHMTVEEMQRFFGGAISHTRARPTRTGGD